jgi:hypothetical protein
MSNITNNEILINITNNKILINITNNKFLMNITNEINNKSVINFNYIYSDQLLCTFQNTILNCINLKCKNLKSLIQNTCNLQCLTDEVNYINYIKELCIKKYKININCNQFQLLTNNLNKCYKYNNVDYINTCFNNILCPIYQNNINDSYSGISYLGILVGIIFFGIICCKTKKLNQRIYNDSI